MRRHLAVIITIIYATSVLLTGCGKKSLPLDYRQTHTIVSTDRMDNYAKGFAYDLAVTDGDVEGMTGATVEEPSAAGIFDINRKRVLYAKDIHAQMAPASLTKVMTALVAIKYGNTEDLITCSENVTDIDYDATRIGLKEGDQLTMNQALHALLIDSANDVAIAIAEHVSGDMDSFVALMNEEALKLGATNTHFVNPHGLTADDHYTTAYDLYLIMNEAMNYELFNEIIQMPDYESVYNDSNGNEKSMKFKTTNLFLRGDYNAPGNVTVLGGKTGTTTIAGNCLILIVKDTQGNPYIAVILKASTRALVNEEMADILREIS